MGKPGGGSLRLDRKVGRALHGAGAKGTAQRVDRMGASWRDQTSPHSLENEIVSVIN